ncbi:hypothetical protein [Fimbriimonas ginsengisoli]|uniref:Uncharacterized protein n=1 Tax=Fimbriimonas ginsengisoli Gsoil 348 TaxID=661478 RepID=A0A068NTV8_FIMGI|nr:hypothetical protein [Fimbriimonas ginsengisoli]AIE85024.1 hypothetical protein OP10G_1656 [Fimbriimonas ginsengisoli Gsoil 348]
MATGTSSIGVIGKWLIVPVLVAALGYFVIAPAIRHQPPPATAAPTSIPNAAETSGHAIANPEVTIERGPAVATRGPEVSISQTPYRPHHHKRKKKPDPKPAEPPKTEVPAPPATEPPVDGGGSGGAATTGGDGTTGTDAGATTGGATGGDTAGSTTGATGGTDTTGLKI